MCLVIVTVRLLAWTTLTLISAATIFASLTTPRWLVGPPMRFGLKSARRNDTLLSSIANWNDGLYHFDRDFIEADYYQPSLGVYNRCTRVHGVQGLGALHCASFINRIDGATNPDHFPTAWQATLVFFSAGLCLLVLTLLASVFGWCFRSIRRKSIFTIGGSIQALAVLLFILGLISYPAGWSSSRVRRVCGEEAEAFLLAECNLGWAFYVAVGGILLTCCSAMFSIQAEISTSTDKVQDRILEGKSIICLP